MAGTETITLKIVAVDLLSGNVTKAISGLDKLAQRGGLVGSVMQGVGQSFGQMLNPVGLATRGIGMLTDTLGDSLRAFQEDQKSQLQLRAALEANIESWDGNTDAIERTIDARTRLGFADDAQRESLASLVTVTENVNDALKIQRTAMDLARLKGIDLASAAKVLGNAYAGATGQLAKMGIRLGKGVSGMEALEAVQERVSGQAEAYAKSSIGKMEALDIKVDELKESIGGLMQGPADMFVGWLSSVVDVLDGPDGANAQVKDLAAEVRNLYTAAANTGAKMPWDIMAEGIQRSTDELEQLRYAIPEAYFPLVEALGPRTRYSLGATSDSLADLADAAVRSGFGFRFLVDQVLSARAGANFLTGTWGRVTDEMKEMDTGLNQLVTDWTTRPMDAFKSSSAQTATWLRQHSGLIRRYWAELPQEIRTATLVAGTFAGPEYHPGPAFQLKLTARSMMTTMKGFMEPWKASWQEAVAWAKDPFSEKKFGREMKKMLRQTMKDAAEAGAKGMEAKQKRLERVASAMRWAIKNNFTDPTKVDILSIVRALEAINRIKVATGTTTMGSDTKVAGRASGGPVAAGRTYVVGESGPEVLTMGASPGYVTPNDRLGGSVNVTVNWQSLTMPTEAEADRIAARLAPSLNRHLARAG